MKNVNKKVMTLAFFGALCLGGCGKSVDDYVNDPALLKSTLEQCAKDAMAGKSPSSECETATKAATQATQKMMQKMMQQ